MIATSPLTEEELSAYRRHPDTFFGTHRPQGRRIEDPLELFDWLFGTYRHTPKGRLLEFMRDRPDIDDLRLKNQQELAISYCEGLVYATMSFESGVQPAAGVGHATNHVTEALDRLCADGPRDDDFAKAAARRTLRRSPW